MLSNFHAWREQLTEHAEELERLVAFKEMELRAYASGQHAQMAQVAQI